VLHDTCQGSSVLQHKGQGSSILHGHGLRLHCRAEGIALWIFPVEFLVTLGAWRSAIFAEVTSFPNASCTRVLAARHFDSSLPSLIIAMSGWRDEEEEEEQEDEGDEEEEEEEEEEENDDDEEEFSTRNAR